MAFNTKNTTPAKAPKPAAAIQTVGVTTNAKGAPAFVRNAKSELFLLAVGRFFGKDTFYETGLAGTDRLVGLVKQVAVEDPSWLLGFVGWLRNSGYIRTAAIVIGLEGAKALLDAGLTDVRVEGREGRSITRQLVSAGVQRGDEPGEALAYWASKYGNVKVKEGGRNSAPHLPSPVKRGIADGLIRVATERASAKWNTASKGFDWADVIMLTHPKTGQRKQEALFKYTLDRKYKGTAAEVPWLLKTLSARKELLAGEADLAEASTEELQKAGIRWENIASQGEMTAAKWEAAIPTMGYMAQLRNLRNFDQAGISNAAALAVQAKLIDPDEVAKSKQFPLRFLTAFTAAPSLRWSYPLAIAADLSLTRVPSLAGRTLILVDTSGSMNADWNGDDKPESGIVRPKLWDAAALFGIALAKRSAGVDLYSYSGGRWPNHVKQFRVVEGAETLKELKRWQTEGFNGGGGTPTIPALQATFKDHDRVLLLTDEQHDYRTWALGTVGGVDKAIPASVPLFTFNLAGYVAGQTESKENRYTFGGLNDRAFEMISWVSDAAAQTWPWERAA